MSELDLDRRTGWPDDLRLFVERYPRAVWPGHANLGQTARFWLERHDMFRDLGAALKSATGEFREGRPAARRVPALVRAAEPRLVRGFEVLEHDHDILHERIARLADAANAFLEASEPGAMRACADRYSLVTDELLSGLVRHLADEEDLIIPLILDR